MKKILVLCVLYVHLAIDSHAQCLPGGITFTNQLQIDNFTADYPGCTQILGFVEISGPDITNLNGLNGITAIQGTDPSYNSLSIHHNDALLTSNGLDGLTSVKGGVSIHENPLLSSIPNLNALTTFTEYGGFIIQFNPSLTSISGFNGMATAPGGLNVNNNNSLPNITGFNLLTNTGSGYVLISNNNVLTSLSGLSALKMIGGLQIVSNPLLPNMNGLNGVTSINGGLLISNCPGLTDMTGLNSLATVLVYFDITQNNGLTSLSGLGSLTTIQWNNLNISDNPSLVSLAGLTSLTSISGGSLLINNNPLLIDLSGLNALTYIRYFINIGYNLSLTSLSGLNAVANNNVGISVYNNSALTSILDFNPGSIAWIQILDNPLLNSCEALSICNWLDLYPNQALISNNAPNCTSEAAIQAVCPGTLPIELLHFSGKREVYGNMLNWQTESEETTSLFDIERNGGGKLFEKIGKVNATGIGANYHFLDDNPAPINNFYRLKIYDHSGSFQFSDIINISQKSEKLSFRIWPNPTNNILYFDITSDLKLIIQLFCLDGRILKNEILENNMLNLSSIPAGIYFIKISEDGIPVWIEKIIKQ